METGKECQCGQQETAALVRRSTQMIEALAEAMGRQRKAEASLAVAQRILRQVEDQAQHRDTQGQACWCDVPDAAWEEEHESGCKAVRHIFRRLRVALREDGGEA